MIYGINFNNTEIPDDLRKRFKLRMAVRKRVMARLVGVATTPAHKSAMVIQATNGLRSIHVETRHTKAGDIFGIYVWHE